MRSGKTGWGVAVLLAFAAGPAWSAPSEAESARFLTQATFGPTTAAIADVSRRDFSGWLDDQMNLPASLHRPQVEVLDLGNTGHQQAQRQEVWWRHVMTANDQLRQRMAFALSEIFVVSDDHSQLYDQPVLLAEYYDILVRNAFGNYRTLLEEVTLSPSMGLYLSMIRNNKPDPKTGRRPDENYAREIMQLFSIGPHQLNPDGSVKRDSGGQPLPTYSQDTIENFARVFTGWGWADGEQLSDGGNSYAPMKAYDANHDMEPKTLLNGFQLPGGRPAEQDLRSALDNIFAHPNVGPFMARRLIQRFTSSNPSPGYIRRVGQVFNDNGQGVRGDLAAMLRAILLDEEARKPGGAVKLREPLLRLSAIWRAFNAAAANRRYNYSRPELDWGQAALRAETVFNFFQPDFRLDGGSQARYAPEFQIQTESQSIVMTNAMSLQVRGRGYCRTAPDTENPGIIFLDFCREVELASTPEALITHLDLLLLYGQMSPRMREVLLAHLETVSENDGLHRARQAIFLIATSPEFAVQK